jgi:hypothetical protein
MARDATRRRVLTAAAAALPLVAAGCKGIAALGTPPKPAPDVTMATDAIAVETQLIARYGAVLAANPGLAGTLRPLLAQHHDHLARLRARLIVPAAGQPLPVPRCLARQRPRSATCVPPRMPRPARCSPTWRPRRRRLPSCWPASPPRRQRMR